MTGLFNVEDVVFYPSNACTNSKNNRRMWRNCNIMTALDVIDILVLTLFVNTTKVSLKVYIDPVLI